MNLTVRTINLTPVRHITVRIPCTASVPALLSYAHNRSHLYLYEALLLTTGLTIVLNRPHPFHTGRHTFMHNEPHF
jgi:hypothetical protein